MEGDTSNLGRRGLRLVVVAAGCYACIVGAATLLGYALDLRRLTDWTNGGISMFPNAAVCALMGGVALLLLAMGGRRQAGRAVLRLAAGVAGLLGALTLFQHLAGVNLGIDTLLFEREWGLRAAMAPMRMGPPASVSFLTIGAGLVLATFGPPARLWASWLGVVVVVVASLSLVGYWFGADQLFGVARYTGIAMQTSSVLAAIGIGLVAAVPERGPAEMLRRDDPGGVITRRLLAPIIILPLALSWARVRAQDAGYFDAAFGSALLGLVMIGMLLMLLWWTGRGLSRQAWLAREAERHVRENERLQRLLAQVGELGAMTPETDELIGAICERVGKDFGVSRCGYTVADLEAGTLTVARDYSGGRPSLAGVYPMSDWSTETLYPGRVVAEEDLSAARLTGPRYEQLWGRLDLRACLSARLYREGRLTAAFWVGHHEPRPWTATEVELIKLIADRVWLVVERKRAEQALRRGEARLRSLIEQLPAGVGVTDSTGRWTLTNSMMELYVPGGIPSASAEQVSRWRFLDERGGTISPERWPGRRALGGETVIPGLEGLYTTDEGREIWMRVSAAPLRDDAGEVIGASCVIQDIDLPKRFRLRLEDELAKRTEEVHRAARAVAVTQRMAAVGTMASGLAHDLKNVLLPLSVRMDGVLAAPGLEGVARTDLTVVVALIDHLRQMARNLELFARDPEQEGSEGATELSAWHRRVLPMLEHSLGVAQGAGIRLRCEVPEGLPPVGLAPHRLAQAVLNLVHNARDAIIAKGEGDAGGVTGTITLEARALQGGAEVLVRVIDDGIGMSDDVRRRCIEPFFTTKNQPGDPTGGERSGSGIGMTLVHAMIQRIGGRLEIDSAPGRGTAITLILPVARGESAGPAAIGSKVHVKPRPAEEQADRGH